MHPERLTRVLLVAWLSVSALLASPLSAATGPVIVDRLPRSLAGEWELALSDPVNGVDGLDGLSFHPIAVPGLWSDGGVKHHGTAWYRLRFELTPSVTSTPLAFSTQQIRDADEVYLDGVLVGRTGAFPPRYEKGTHVPRVYTLPADLTSRSGAHVLAVRVHNPGPRGGGITGEPRLESVSSALLSRQRRDLPSLLLAAAVASLGLTCLFFYLRDRDQKDFLYFFLYTCAFGVYLLTRLAFWNDMGVSPSLVFRLYSAGGFLLFALLTLFLHRLFVRPLLARHRALLGVVLACSLACLFWPRVDDLHYIQAVLHLAVLVGGTDLLVSLSLDARGGIPYARAILSSCVLLLLAAAADIAREVGLVGDQSGPPRFIGPAFFVFSAVFLAVAADRFARIREAATTDPLTGVANRIVLFERIALEIARARRHIQPMTVAVLDLDLFKTFNDRFGHVVGDKLLVGTARAVESAIRDTDLVARYGGEEFVVVLPEANSLDALVCLERVRRAVADVRVSGVPEGVTVSIGVAIFDPEAHGTVTVTALFKQADRALYQAKAGGRDRIVVSDGAPRSTSSSGSFQLDSFKRPEHRPKAASGSKH